MAYTIDNMPTFDELRSMKRADALELLEPLAQQHAGMTGLEFRRAWNAPGELERADRERLRPIARLLQFAYGPRDDDDIRFDVE
jgi:hypothetical protein